MASIKKPEITRDQVLCFCDGYSEGEKMCFEDMDGGEETSFLEGYLAGARGLDMSSVIEKKFSEVNVKKGVKNNG